MLGRPAGAAHGNWGTRPDIACITPDISADQRAILQPVVNNADPDADILRMPEPQICERNSRRSEDKFFILTSAEAYAAKLKQKETKDKLEHEKQVCVEKKNNKIKHNKENAKKPSSSKRNSNVLQNDDDTQDTTACMYCEIQYWDVFDATVSNTQRTNNET